PAASCFFKSSGSASASTLRPTASADAGTYAAVLLASDRFVQLKCVAPKCLAAKGVIAKYLSSLIDHRLGVAINLVINIVLRRWSSRSNDGAKQRHCAKRHDYQYFPLALEKTAASCKDAAF